MQQPASWLRHAPICFALMPKSPPNFSWPDFYFQVFENICQSLRNTHGNLGINAGFSLVKNAAGVLETARNPCYVPTDAAAKPCCFIHLLGCFFVKSSQCWSWTFILCSAADVSHCGPVSWSLNDRTLILLEQNWRNMADCCFLDHHLYLGVYQSRLTFTSSTHMFYFIHKISLWLDCPWCWGEKSPIVEN